MSEPVVFLAFDNPDVRPQGVIEMIACGHCANKTFTAVVPNSPGRFPMLKCAACTTEIGRFGWAPPED